MEPSGFGSVDAGERALPRLVAILSLLLGIAAPAQPLPATRERIERRVVLSGNPAEAAPEVRISSGIATLLLFDAPLDRDAVELEGRARFRFVEVGERALVLEPSVDLGQGERLTLRVRYSDGAAPLQGAFALVSDPSEVDARVEVFRRRDSIELLQVELADVRSQLASKDAALNALHARCEASGPAGLVIAGLLDIDGVRGHRIERTDATKRAGGLALEDGLALHAASWSVVSIFVRNDGTEPWTATSARLSSLSSGERVDVMAVRTKGPAIAPGESGLVVIETKAPPERAGEIFRLEVGEGSEKGRRLSLKVVFKVRSN
ncbi:DUF2381 family protein [Myxococcus sp. 1LA]